jgi:hypothetical protein
VVFDPRLSSIVFELRLGMGIGQPAGSNGVKFPVLEFGFIAGEHPVISTSEGSMVVKLGLVSIGSPAPSTVPLSRYPGFVLDSIVVGNSCRQTK